MPTARRASGGGPPPQVPRVPGQPPNAHLIHLPVHASWLDQAEIYFSVVQRKVVAPNDFTDLDQIRERLTAFEPRYNAVATPFNWKFTRRELENLLQQLDTHDNPAQPQRQAA